MAQDFISWFPSSPLCTPSRSGVCVCRGGAGDVCVGVGAGDVCVGVGQVMCV